MSRKNYQEIAKNVFDNALEREEKRRLRLIEDAKTKLDGSEKNYYQYKNKSRDFYIFISVTYNPRKK
ncbi:hypothetical protein J4465_02600, partial [Candidatus Pacearchaeota archaeon]|nr:hypothetical protein [Candidatus Pacearchaeota archaeon]